MPRKSYECCFFMCVIIEIVLIGVTIKYGLKYNDSLKYNQLKCNITRIEYPDKIPTTIEEYNNNFVNVSYLRIKFLLTILHIDDIQISKFQSYIL